MIFLFNSELVSCATDKMLFIWDLNVCERVKKLKGHRSFVNSASISRTEAPLICSGSDDCTVRVWDRRQRACALTYEDRYQVLAVAFNNTSEQVFFAGIDNDIKVWDTRMTGLLYKMVGHSDCPTGLELSPDGHFLASNAMDSTGLLKKKKLLL